MTCWIRLMYIYIHEHMSTCICLYELLVIVDFVVAGWLAELDYSILNIWCMEPFTCIDTYVRMNLCMMDWTRACSVFIIFKEHIILVHARNHVHVTLCAYVHERIRICGISSSVVRRCGQRLKTSRRTSMCVYSIQAPYRYPQRLSLCIRSACKKKNLNSCNRSFKVPKAA